MGVLVTDDVERKYRKRRGRGHRQAPTRARCNREPGPWRPSAIAMALRLYKHYVTYVRMYDRGYYVTTCDMSQEREGPRPDKDMEHVAEYYDRHGPRHKHSDMVHVTEH